LYDYLTNSGYARAIKTIRELKSDLDELQRKEEDYHKTTWTTRRTSIEDWFKIGEQNQQAINEIIASDQSEGPKQEGGNLKRFSQEIKFSPQINDICGNLFDCIKILKQNAINEELARLASYLFEGFSKYWVGRLLL
jgi:hypothetical protein